MSRQFDPDIQGLLDAADALVDDLAEVAILALSTLEECVGNNSRELRREGARRLRKTGGHYHVRYIGLRNELQLMNDERGAPTIMIPYPYADLARIARTWFATPGYSESQCAVLDQLFQVVIAHLLTANAVDTLIRTNVKPPPVNVNELPMRFDEMERAITSDIFSKQGFEVRRELVALQRYRWKTADKPTVPVAIPEATAAAAGDGRSGQQQDGGDGPRGVGEGAEMGEPPKAWTNRDAVLKELSPSHRKAYLSFECAEQEAAQNENARRLKDKEAYKWLRENGIDVKQNDELADYILPKFKSWKRYVQRARKALGEQKNSPRHGREHGKSIIRAEERDGEPFSKG